jgi:hypothetical protein
MAERKTPAPKKLKGGKGPRRGNDESGPKKEGTAPHLLEAGHKYLSCDVADVDECFART